MSRTSAAPVFRAAIVCGCFLSLALVAGVRADDPGQADLDKATELKVTAQTLKDLDEVISLCDSAIRKGLDEANTQFAKSLITSTLYQRATVLTAGIFAENQDNRWQFFRDQALRDLGELLDYDPSFVDAHLLIGRLESLPGGNARRGRKAVERAAELVADNKSKLSEVLMLKAQLAETDEQKMAILAQAIEADPTNAKAHQLRAGYLFEQGKLQEAIAAIEEVLKQDPENTEARFVMAEALMNLKQFDKAIEQANKGIEQQPESPLGHWLLARIHIAQEKLEESLKSLDKAIEVDGQFVEALLLRAQVLLSAERPKEALADVDRTLAIRPVVQALVLRSMIHADMRKYDEAINDMRLLVESSPANVEWRLQLAMLFNASERPRKAIDIYNEILGEDEQNWRARRGRADALLSIGKHAEAVADYAVAIKAQPEHSGILNNYAWVLATSPKDDVRDAEQAIKLATKACEVTEYKEAHILSTLGAAYAESGDFETAIQWSQKAVELGEDDVKDQLKKELESYQQKKPWRELQETKEKPGPALRGGNRQAA